VALPGEAPRTPPRSGDLLVRVALGQPGLGHLAVLTDPVLIGHYRLATATDGAERGGPGFYATVTDDGPVPHTRADRFARLVLDAHARMPNRQLLLRPTAARPPVPAGEGESGLEEKGWRPPAQPIFHKPSTMQTQYNAQILRLDLPEQDALKYDAERCSADPGTLQSIGRDVGHQVRIIRADRPEFFALYTVATANPPGHLSDPSRANVVRTGLQGRERLGTPNDTPDEMNAVVQATVVDAQPPQHGARFFEVAEGADHTQTYLIAIAPHGGDIENATDDEAKCLRSELASNGRPVTTWICKGFGDHFKKASDRWHITSTDLNPACFPALSRIATRQFSYGVAFHGFFKPQNSDLADLYIGGGASHTLKTAICKELVANLPRQIKIKIATADDDPKFQGRKPENLINRLAGQGIHIEQSSDARKFSEQIAKAVANVYRSL
jgi:phage replication-related protein YjqB (UPF0714/DUF867 family)